MVRLRVGRERLPVIEVNKEGRFSVPLFRGISEKDKDALVHIPSSMRKTPTLLRQSLLHIENIHQHALKVLCQTSALRCVNE